MRKIVGLFLMSVLIVSCSNAQEEKSGTEKQLSEAQTIALVGKAEFQERMKDERAQLVDVRSPNEVAQGKIGEAAEMNFFDADFQEQIGTLDKTKPVLVYCASGGRSAKTVAIMKNLGFSEIYELDGGYNAWVQ